MNLTPDDIQAIARAVVDLLKAEGPSPVRRASGMRPFNDAEFAALEARAVRTRTKADKQAVTDYMATHYLPGKGPVAP
jgi:hypothetical protein